MFYTIYLLKLCNKKSKAYRDNRNPSFRPISSLASLNWDDGYNELRGRADGTIITRVNVPTDKYTGAQYTERRNNVIIIMAHLVLKIALLRTDGPEVRGSIFSTNQIVIFMP